MSRIPNPYIVGTPIPGQEFFYGREDLLSFVRDTLNPPQQRVVVLYGQRRIGKTSVLYELARRLRGEFHAVYFDLMGQANRPLTEALHELAAQIAEMLAADPPESFADPHQFRTFLSETCAALPDGRPADNRPLLLLLDEFDDLSDQEVTADAAALTLFDYLRDLLNVPLPVAFVFVVGRRLTELPQNFQSILKQAPSRRVAFLNETETQALIARPAQETLAFTQAAIDAIFHLTSGHPYFTQLICFELFRKARNEEKERVEADDVTAVLDRALETGKGGLAWFWDGLPLAERFVMSAIAEISGPDATASTEDVRRLLASYDLRFLGLEVTDAPNLLVQWEILRDTGGGYQFTVDLVRRWILAEHPMAQARREVENISPRANRYFANARDAHQAGDLDLAVEDYRRALGANPNHLRAQLGLAQVLEEKGLFISAHEEYGKAFALDQASARDSYAHSYDQLAAIDQKNGRLEKALFNYEQALALVETPARHEKIKKVQVSLADAQSRRDLRWRRIRRGLTAVTSLGIVAVVGLFVISLLGPQIGDTFSQIRDSLTNGETTPVVSGLPTAVPGVTMILIADFDGSEEVGLNPQANLEIALAETFPDFSIVRAANQVITSKNKSTLTRELMQATGATAVIYGWVSSGSIGTDIAFLFPEVEDVETFDFGEFQNKDLSELTGADLSQVYAPDIAQTMQSGGMDIIASSLRNDELGQAAYYLAGLSLMAIREHPDASDQQIYMADDWLGRAFTAGFYSPVYQVDTTGVEILFVPSGEFERGRAIDGILEICRTLGTDCSEFASASEPVEIVYLDAFFIDRFEVTNDEWRQCVAALWCPEPAGFESGDGRPYYSDPAKGDYPVIWVGWEEAKTYCEMRGGRLPTEAEWEKAARWNPVTGSQTFPWGDNLPDENLANFGNIKGEAAPVGAFQEGRSPIGAEDMIGNVWEWVNDWFDPDYYQNEDTDNPQGPENGSLKVFRGGAYDNLIVDPAYRAGHDPTGNSLTGFRCAFDNPFR